jgi:hypothetical protein
VQLTQARSEQVSVRKEEILVLHVEAQEENKLSRGAMKRLLISWLGDWRRWRNSGGGRVRLKNTKNTKTDRPKKNKEDWACQVTDVGWDSKICLVGQG